MTDFCTRCGRNYVVARDGSMRCWCPEVDEKASLQETLRVQTVLATTQVQVTFEIKHPPSVDSEDLGRRISEVVHAATNGLSFDEEKLLHDVQMFGVAVVGHRATRMPPR